MSDLIQFEQQALAHHLQRAYFLRISFLRQIDLSVAALTDLGEDLEIAMSQTSSPFA